MNKDIEEDIPQGRLIFLKDSVKIALTIRGAKIGKKLKPYIEYLCELDSKK